MASPSYPAALDALANPGPTTETDDAGYELDIVVARLQNCVMAIEQKLGIGTGAPPGSAAVLRRTATGSSGWGQIATGDIAAAQIGKRQLNYVASTDFWNGTTVGAGTQPDFSADQTFNLEQSNSLVGITVRASVYASGFAGEMQTRLVVDGGAVIANLGGCSANASAAGNPFSGSGTVWLNTLAGGSHTVKTQLFTSVAIGNLYCRCATQPSIESFSIQVVEYLR